MFGLTHPSAIGIGLEIAIAIGKRGYTVCESGVGHAADSESDTEAD